MAEMQIQEVLEYLPQRFPIIMIDRVLELEPNKRIVALKNVSVNEPFFPGHFPRRPIMPGVLILEAMAQAACILVFRSQNIKPDHDQLYYYAGIDRARFKRPVLPGDQLKIEVTIAGMKQQVWKFSCAARVADALVAEADILATMRAPAEPGA